MAVDSVGSDRSRDVGGTSRTTDVGGNKNDVSSSVERDMSAVTPSEMRTEAANLVDGQVDDTVERVGQTHTVQRGDNLTHIARDHGVSLRELEAANPQIRNRDLIHPGQQINLPSGASAPGANGVASVGVPNPGSIDGLARGMSGPEVEQLQQRLTELGYATGPVDGKFGPITQQAVRSFQGSNDVPTSGTIDPATSAAIGSPDARGPRPIDPGSVPQLGVYTPGSPEQIALFQQAARQAGLPEEWASSRGLINLLNAESGGKVGIPNYTYGDRARDPSQWGSIHDELKAGRITARSSATGLGQLLLSNVDRYYPSGRAGIGNPTEEAAGMLRYIQDRYGTPDAAWARYNTAHEGY